MSVGEGCLDKILRLSTVRSYRRVENGRVQQVRSYINRKVRRVAWGSLKVGMVVQIAGQNYRVARVRVPPLTTTTGKYTASKGKGVNTGTSAASSSSSANPQAAALGGAKVAKGTPTVTNEIVQLRTNRAYFVTLPTGWGLTVVG